MLLIYILLGIIAVGVLLLSPQGRTALVWAGTLLGGVIGLAVIGISLFLVYLFLMWLNEGGDLQETVAIWIFVLFAIGYFVYKFSEWKREGKTMKYFVKKIREEAVDFSKEGFKALKTVLFWFVISLVGLVLLALFFGLVDGLIT